MADRRASPWFGKKETSQQKQLPAMRQEPMWKGRSKASLNLLCFLQTRRLKTAIHTSAALHLSSIAKSADCLPCCSEAANALDTRYFYDEYITIQSHSQAKDTDTVAELVDLEVYVFSPRSMVRLQYSSSKQISKEK